jgi:flavin-dependent dehydrogenase
LTRCPLFHAFDVIVIGAGPAGAAAAIALRRAGIDRVALVRDLPGHARRTSETAPPRLHHLLCSLGLSSELGQVAHAPYHGNVSLWAKATPEINDFLYGGLGHGWHLDRDVFDVWLVQAAIQSRAILIETNRMVSVECRDRLGWRMIFDSRDGRIEMSAAAVIVATGRSHASWLGAGAKLRRIDQLVALAVSGRAHWIGGFQEYAFVEAVEYGWWYAARLPNGTATVMLMTDADLAVAHRLRNPMEFIRAWERTQLISTFARPVPPDECTVKVFPAATQYLDRAAGRGWWIVGDALLALDPLSASGIHGAITDAIEAARRVAWVLGAATAVEANDVICAYAERANRTLQRFLVERRVTYSTVHRWRNSPFWQRRVLPIVPGVSIVHGGEPRGARS